MSDLQDQPIAAIESEQALIGALVRGHHPHAVRVALPNPGTCFRRDHIIAAEEAYRQLDRGTTPDARLIAASVGHLLDSVPYLYEVASHSIALTPDRIVEHGRRIAAAFAARRVERAIEELRARLHEQPSSVYNGAAADLTGVLAEIHQEGGADPIRLLDDVAILEQPDPQPLIAGYWWQTSFAATYGPPGTGKTALFISKGIAECSGRPFFGITPAVRGPVVLIVGEGSAFLKNRILAAKLEAGLDLDTVVGFHVIPAAIDFMNPAKIRSLIERLRPLRPIDIGVDTLSRMMAIAGGEDSSQRDIGVVTNSVDMIRQELGAAVHLLHHTGWNEDRERGSSALRGAVDTLASISDADGVLTLKCEKQKDAPDFSPLQFRLKPVDLGPGQDGKPRSACVVVPVDSVHDDRDVGLAESYLEALDVLTRTFPGGATQTQWHAAMPEGYHARKLYRARAALLERDLVVERGGKLQAKSTVKTPSN